jgi:ectoine hydroxylase-related dioxygenase (phytanoyl-CoA dioxygenase family)
MKRVAFEELWGERVPAAIDAVLGAGRWQRPADAGQLLTVTPPEPGAEWHLPHKMWHLDYPAPAAARGPRGLQLFLCLDRVEPRAGGTLVAAGSHRLVDALRRRRPERWPGRSADVRESLRREVEWLRALWTLRPGEDRVARFLEKPAAEAGVELQVLELTGEPGDVILMHPWILHSLSANCGTRPRMVVTVRIQTLAC